MAFTKRDIDRMQWDPDGRSQQIAFYGSEEPGFGVRIYPSGRKTFVQWIRTRTGRKRLMKIGRYGDLTLDDARKRASKMRVDAADGKDPGEDQRVKVREIRTFNDLADLWLDQYAKLHRKQWREDQRRLKKHVRPRIGRVDFDRVTPADVREIHAAIGRTTPVEANRVASLVRAIYNKAARWGTVPPGHLNPAAGLERFRERSRERWLTAPELKRLVTALASEVDVFGVAAIKLLVLTGCRKTELLRARWDRFDREGRRLLLEDTKTGDPKVVPLSAPALAIVDSLPRAMHRPEGKPRAEPSPWLFPSPRNPSEPLQDVKRAWNRVRKTAKVPDATIHDLRRTTGSWLVQRGVPLKVIGAALGHRDTRATEVYARIAATQPAEALEMLGEAFGGMLTGERTG
jgi:integrase